MAKGGGVGIRAVPITVEKDGQRLGYTKISTPSLGKKKTKTSATAIVHLSTEKKDCRGE